MKTILILLTILAISCSPVRRSNFKYDPDGEYENQELTENEGNEDSTDDEELSEDEYDEYQPDNIDEEYQKSMSDVYYPDNSVNNMGNDTMNLDTLYNMVNPNDINATPKKRNVNKTSYGNTEIISETIVLSDNANPDKLDIINDYDKALKFFDNGNYSAAEKKLKALSETLKENDTLVYETKFYIAECHVAKNEFTEALEILKKLDKNVEKNSEITQKTLVRLGQIYCVLGMNKEAETYFKKLKSKYPNSVYNKLAKCK